MNLNTNTAPAMGIANKHSIACGIGGGSQMQRRIETPAPLAQNIEKEDVAKFAIYLLSDLASAVTGDLLNTNEGCLQVAY